MRLILPVFFSFFLVFSAGAQVSPKAYAAYTHGMELKEKNLFPEALDSFKRAVAISKKFDSAYVEIARLHTRVNQIDSAVLVLRKVIGFNPKMTSAYLELATIYKNLSPNLDSALKNFSLAYQSDSSNKFALYGLAWCYNSKADYDNAIRHAIRALEIDNTYKAAYNELGHAYHKTQRYAEAVEQFKKNLSVSVVDLALYYSGLCYAQLKDKENAQKMYEQLKTVNEKMAGALKRNLDKMQ